MWPLKTLSSKKVICFPPPIRAAPRYGHAVLVFLRSACSSALCPCHLLEFLLWLHVPQRSGLLERQGAGEWRPAFFSLCVEGGQATLVSGLRGEGLSAGEVCTHVRSSQSSVHAESLYLAAQLFSFKVSFTPS